MLNLGYLMSRLSFFRVRKPREMDRTPTRPMYIMAMSRHWLSRDRVEVMPVVSPTVPRAEAVS